MTTFGNFSLSRNIPVLRVSESVVESTEDSFSKSESLVPAPPAFRRRLTLGSLLVVGCAALWVVSLLIPDASYALTRDDPVELGNLSTARLPREESWVSASGIPKPSALSFARLGERGSFMLTRATQREDVWLLLRVPLDVPSAAREGFVPPTHFVGRFGPVTDSQLLPPKIRTIIVDQSKSSGDAFVLIDGESPNSQRPSLYAAILLALLGVACLSSAVFLWRDVKTPLSRS